MLYQYTNPVDGQEPTEARPWFEGMEIPPGGVIAEGPPTSGWVWDGPTQQLRPRTDVEILEDIEKPAKWREMQQGAAREMQSRYPDLPPQDAIWLGSKDWIASSLDPDRVFLESVINKLLGAKNVVFAAATRKVLAGYTWENVPQVSLASADAKKRPAKQPKKQPWYVRAIPGLASRLDAHDRRLAAIEARLERKVDVL